MFQVANRKTGLFFFALVFLGALFTVCLSIILSSKHPLEQAACGGSAPYCLGAAQIKAGGI
jgi:hypothetical protein